MTTVRELLVKLGVDADRAKLEQFDKALEGVKATAVGALKVVAGLAAGLVALGGAATGSAEELAEEARTIEQQSKLLGVTTDRYQELRYAVKGYGVDVGDLADVYAQIAGKAKDAEGGNKDAVDSFKALGISVKDLKGLSPDGLMKLLAERGGQAADQMSWLANVSKVFGEEGARQFGPLLKDGAANFDALAKKARELGLVMSGDSLAAARAYGAESAQLKGTLTSLKQEITLALMPTLTALAKRVREWIQANRPVIQGTIQRAVRGLSTALAVTESLVKKLGGGSTAQGLERLAKLFASGLGIFATIKAGSALYSIFLLIKSALAIISGVGAIAVAKIAAVVAIVAVLGLAIEDVITYFRGGDSLLGRMLARAEKGGGVLAKLVGFLKTAGRTISLLFQVIGKVIGALFARVVRVVEPLLGLLFSLIGTYWEQYGSPALSLILDVFTALFGKLGGGLEDLLTNWDEYFGELGIIADGVADAILAVYMAVFGTIKDGIEAVLVRVNTVLGALRKLAKAAGVDVGDVTPSTPGDGSFGAIAGRATANAFSDIRQRASAAAGSIANSFGPTTYQVTQQPGEDGADFARRVDTLRRADDAKKARLARSRAKGER